MAKQLEGLSFDDRMRVLEQQGALGALSEHMRGRLDTGDRAPESGREHAHSRTFWSGF